MTNFTDCRLLHGAQVSPLLAPVLARYKQEPPKISDGLHRFEITIQTNADISAIFAALPNDTHLDFVKIAAKMSVALQETLRVWLPYIWFSDVDRYEEFRAAAALICYSVCRPFKPKNKHFFTFDILDDDTPRAMHYSIERNLGPKLATVEPMLRRLRPEWARQYAPRRMQRLIATFRRNRHALNGLLVADRDIVETYVNMGMRSREEDGVERARGNLRRKLRHLFAGDDFRCLQPLLEIEAARAAARAMGKEFSFCVKLSRIQERTAGPVALSRHVDVSIGHSAFHLLPSCLV